MAIEAAAEDDGSAWDSSAVGPQLKAYYEAPLEINGVKVSGEFGRQAERMPQVLQRLLLHGECPSEVPAETLLEELKLPKHKEERARLALESSSADSVHSLPAALDEEACFRLRAAVDTQRQTKCDTVDGSPDHQLNLSVEELQELIGEACFTRLTEFAGPLLRQGSPEARLPDPLIFVRRYSADSRPWFPFHVDSARLTINVALCDDSTFQGGRLLACCEGAVRLLSRREGEATAHSSTLLHGVTMMTAGVRYSLILFFGDAVAEGVAFDEAMRQADCAALKRVLEGDGEFESRCRRVLGEAKLRGMLDDYRALQEQPEPGRCIERVVVVYGAPYLRPSTWPERLQSPFTESADGVCWSALALLRYCIHGGVSANLNEGL
eukprot:TRINITY_DN17826_c0_g1_i3.p1 TRINITY_DN17826_c0_g1~~TRINITY_DN17826_c0_g1_i3.p1  ORF type:complete len:381 (-),score=53.07 TRINITY_DN17826_c0_g1_i3:417-1559(-)